MAHTNNAGTGMGQSKNGIPKMISKETSDGLRKLKAAKEDTTQEDGKGRNKYFIA